MEEQAAFLQCVQAHRYTHIPYMASQDLAAFLGRRHGYVRKTVSDVLTDHPDLAANFIAAKYEARGKKHDCYQITEKGIEILMLRFTGDVPNQFKYLFVEAFNCANEQVRRCSDARTGSIDMARALQDQRAKLGKETVAHNFINEHNLIYKVAFGATAKNLVKKGRFSDRCPIAEQMTAQEVHEVAELRSLETKLLNEGRDYHDRKEKLLEFHKHFIGSHIAIEEQQI